MRGQRSLALTPRGTGLRERVRVLCVPVRREGKVIGVLTREAAPSIGRQHGELERTYLDIFNRFARMIAADQGVTDAWERAQATGEETFVPLRSEIPVRLLYHPAFVDGGRVMFRDDAYGWDEDVAEALGLARRARRTVRTHVQDVGP